MLTTLFEKLLEIRIVFAQSGQNSPPTSGDIRLPNPLGVSTIEELFFKIWGYLYTISIPIVAIMVIIGAFQIMFAAGNVEKVETGKKTVLYAVVGFAIILLAGGVISLLKELLGVSTP